MTTRAEKGHASACDVFFKRGTELDVCTCAVGRAARAEAELNRIRQAAPDLASAVRAEVPHADACSSCDGQAPTRCDCDHERRVLAILQAAGVAIERVRAQLPEGMPECTIRFRTCERGHGWLTATNWVQHGCPTCELAELRAQLVATDRAAGLAADVALRANSEAGRYQRESAELRVSRDDWKRRALTIEEAAKGIDRELREAKNAALKSPVHYGTSVQIACFTLPEANPQQGESVSLDWSQVTCPNCLTTRRA